MRRPPGTIPNSRPTVVRSVTRARYAGESSHGTVDALVLVAHDTSSTLLIDGTSFAKSHVTFGSGN